MRNDRFHRFYKRKFADVAALFAAVWLISATGGFCAEMSAAKPAAIAPEAASAPQITAREMLYDLDASGTDVRSVLEALARRSGANIVVSPEVTGQINAHLKQKSLEDILDFLSQVQGFGWKRDGNTYLVASKATLNPADAVVESGPVQTMVWDCKNIVPEDLVTMTKDIYPNVKTTIAPEPAGPSIDSLQSQLKTNSSAAASATTQAATKKKTRMVVFIGKQADLDAISDLLKKLDVPRKMVYIEVEVRELKGTTDNSLGVDWSWDDFVFQLTAGSWGPTTDQGSRKITAKLSALFKDGNSKLLAKPNLSVVDGESARVLIGDKVKYPRLSQRDVNGHPIYEIAEEEVGISLQIAPKITSADEVILSVYPQVSIISSYLKFEGSEYPQVSTREASTTVKVRDGNSLAIGGLLRDDEVKNASKVPFMGDLPIIGHLFRSTSVKTERTNIVILITPRIVGG